MVQHDLGKPLFQNSVVNRHRSGDDQAEVRTGRPGHGTTRRSVEELGRMAADVKSEEQPSLRCVYTRSIQVSRLLVYLLLLFRAAGTWPDITGLHPGQATIPQHGELQLQRDSRSRERGGRID
ncbi:hypothetical protein QQF64_033694 [Cirrhinus molitorella]|uniref:Uncharacterized protein n=1 Tax=Cirrhinus molitorella TaxID=172907 RepID=A0ABR3MUJ9_9TELE